MNKNIKILQKNKHFWDFSKESDSLRISEVFFYGTIISHQKTSLRKVSWRNFQGLLSWTELVFEDSYLQFCKDLTYS